ncbi:efflux RND transporter periplasmic adaptor subunit [Syntrophorhabdus aromaticivorans]|uniref:Efflux RND transporter periplasmic adaptor subunit n=1 Tax=Syntrophorhabdus aromaticivorans TaxID=328301 RepID=A0A971S151_9BACT|nr:efflux RND transporter periplasmic adaptor subunit [Syntrophorhabdus aromaticivorans]NLW34862.1 efflux RND transporter periplasmic adaptor subunit [Syntrophorhabdus aromaticivorans]
MPDQDLSGLKIDKSQITVKPARQRRLFYLMAGVLLVVLVFALYVAGVFTPGIKVDIATAALSYPSQSFTLLNASGYVVPQRKAAVAAKVTGRLVALYVEEGSRVKKDQIIARLEADDVSAARDQAQANLEVARQNLEQARAELADAGAAFEREKTLLTQEFTTKAAFDTAEARYRKAQAAFAAAGANIRAGTAALRGAAVGLEYTVIRAPFDAVVLTKNADIGDIVTPIGAAANAKAAVVTIADMASLQVETDVSESNLGQITVGRPCEIQLDAIPDTRFKGVIHMIVPTADRTKATVMVKVRFLTIDSRVLPEMSAKVAFLSREVHADEQEPRLAVSRKALKVRNGKAFVFVVRGDKAFEAPLSVGAQLGDMVEVKDGIRAGDRVVTNPPDSLRNGSRIKSGQS